MNELVNKILDIEKKANEMIENEKNKLLNIEDEVEKILILRTKQFKQKEIIRIEKIREFENNDEAFKIKEMEESFLVAVNRLTDGITKNKEKWVSEIFEKVIS
jgi:hypothetical protein